MPTMKTFGEFVAENEEHIRVRGLTEDPVHLVLEIYEMYESECVEYLFNKACEAA